MLFPEFVSRVVRQGMESDILPDITATVTILTAWTTALSRPFRRMTTKELKRVEEGAGIPTTPASARRKIS